jgi:hypothetical protein
VRPSHRQTPARQFSWLALGLFLATALVFGMFWLHGFVSDKGGIVSALLFVKDATGDAALKRSTLVGQILASLGVAKLYEPESGVPVVDGTPVGSDKPRDLPAALLERSDRGWLAGSGPFRRGVSWWSSAHRNDATRSRSVCFAFPEIACLGGQVGGLGRVVWQQVGVLARATDWNITVFVLDSSLEAEAKPPLLATPHCERALLLPDGSWRPNVRVIQLASGAAGHVHGLPSAIRSHSLAQFALAFPDTCQVLHTSDFGGVASSLLSLQRALRPSMPWEVVVQVHGTDTEISAGYLLNKPGKDVSDVGMNALERISLTHASSLMLLSSAQIPSVRSQTGFDPESAWVAPNFLPRSHSGPCQPHQHTRLRPRSVIVYGRLKFLKGLHLTAAALTRLVEQHRNKLQQVLFVGHKAVDGGELSKILAHLIAIGVNAQALTHLDSAGVRGLLREHAADAVVVVPSLFENQPLALFDLVQAGSCALVSDIWAHRTVLAPSLDPTHLFFEPSPNGLATALARVLESGIECQSLCPDPSVRGGEDAFVAWNNKTMALRQQQHRASSTPKLLPTPEHVVVAAHAVSSTERSEHALAKLAQLSSAHVIALLADPASSCPPKPVECIRTTVSARQDSQASVRNLGVERAMRRNPRLIVLVDADSGQWVTLDGLEALYQASVSHPEAAVIAGLTAREVQWEPAPQGSLGVGVGAAPELGVLTHLVSGSAPILALSPQSPAWGSGLGVLPAVFEEQPWSGCHALSVIANALWADHFRVSQCRRNQMSISQCGGLQSPWFVPLLHQVGWSGRTDDFTLPWGDHSPELLLRCIKRSISAMSRWGYSPELATWAHLAASGLRQLDSSGLIPGDF